MPAFRLIRRLRDLLDVNDAGLANGDVPTYNLATDTFTFEPAGGGGGAPTTADYLVGTANAGLSAEIVVGTAPGGELGGTWASPTVDATHSGSTHAAVQAAAEATAAAALNAHLTDATDAHDASAVSFAPAGSIAATDVQAAIVEVAAEAGSSEWDAIITKSANEIVNNSDVLQDDNELFFSVTAATIYYFELVVIYDGSINADFRHAFSVAAGTVPGTRYMQDGGTTSFTAHYSILGDLTTTATAACLGIGTPCVLQIQGAILPSNTTTFTFRWAQQASIIADTTVYKGSRLMYRALD